MLFLKDTCTEHIMLFCVSPLFISFYRATACNATHSIAKAVLSVRPSVCPSVKRVHCDKAKETCAHILIPYQLWKKTGVL